jgi:uncharacterized membrane protein
MPTGTAVSIHILVGVACILLYWAAIVQRKGSRAHRAYGRWFLLSWIPLLSSVAALLFLGSGKFSPPELIQFVYLTVCVITVSSTAYLAIRLKGDLDRFRGAWFKILGGFAFLLGLIVLSAGIATGNPTPMIFSIIGLLFGGAMLRFAFLRDVHPNWSLIWHLNGMTFLFNAVHGTVLAVLYRMAIDPSAGEEINYITQIGTMGIALALRVFYGRRFDAPIRLMPEKHVAEIKVVTRNMPGAWPGNPRNS